MRALAKERQDLRFALGFERKPYHAPQLDCVERGPEFARLFDHPHAIVRI